MIILLGLEAHVASLKLVDHNLYAANTIESFMIPSTVSGLKKESKSLVGNLCNYKVEKKGNEKDECTTNVFLILAIYFKHLQHNQADLN